MQGIFTKREGIDFSAPMDNTLLSLLANHDNVDIMMQTIKKNSLVWISPAEDKSLTEFFYVVSGSLTLDDDKEKISLHGNDFFYVSGLCQAVLLKSKTPLKMLYIATSPVYNYLNSFNGDLKDLLKKIEEKDQYTNGHSIRVMEYSLKICAKMKCANTVIDNIAVSALFHDVGKCFIPDQILKKTGKLELDEWRHIYKHPIHSKRLLEAKFGAKIAEIALKHHERLDGSGYPYGLKSVDIPLEAKIIAVADSLDAMTTKRPYNLLKSFQQAADEICAASHLYDCEIAEALKDLVSNGEIGGSFIN